MARKTASSYFIPLIVAVSSGVIGFVFMSDQIVGNQSTSQVENKTKEINAPANMNLIEQMVRSTIIHDEKVLREADREITKLEQKLQELRSKRDSSSKRLTKLRSIREVMDDGAVVSDANVFAVTKAIDGTLQNQNDNKVITSPNLTTDSFKMTSSNRGSEATLSVDATSLLKEKKNKVVIDDSRSALLSKATQEFSNNYQVEKTTMYVSPSTPTNVVKALTTYLLKQFNWSVEYQTGDEKDGVPYNVRIDVKGKRKGTDQGS